MYRKPTGHFDILQAPLRVLRWHQLWPQEGEPLTSLKSSIRAAIVLAYFSLTFWSVIFHFLYIIQHPEHIIIIDLIEDIIAFIVHITVYYTIYALLSHKKEVDEFIRDLSDYSRFGKPPNIDEANKKSNWFSYFFYFYGCMGTLTYSTVGLLGKSKCLKTDINHTRICGFLLPGRLPFNMDTPLKFSVVWITQTLSVVLFLNSGIIIMAFIYASVEIYISKIQHLRAEILKLSEYPEHARKGIRYCVEYHVKIISMCKNLNVCWGSLMLYHQLLVSIIMSLIGIQFLLKPDSKPLMHAGGWFISLAIPCYAGQRLLDESSLIPWAMYATHWYDLDNATRKDLVYMIMCGNNYLDLNRDGYGPMNMSIVGEVVNNIYSVLTLLYGSMEEQSE